jgi:hypothetical protein
VPLREAKSHEIFWLSVPGSRSSAAAAETGTIGVAKRILRGFPWTAGCGTLPPLGTDIDSFETMEPVDG